MSSPEREDLCANCDQHSALMGCYQCEGDDYCDRFTSDRMDAVAVSVGVDPAKPGADYSVTLFTQQQVDEAIALAVKERGLISHGGDPMFAKAEVEQMLDRLEASKPDYNDMDSYNRSFLEAMYKGTIDKAIQAERDALRKRGGR